MSDNGKDEDPPAAALPSPVPDLSVVHGGGEDGAHPVDKVLARQNALGLGFTQLGQEQDLLQHKGRPNLI